MSIYITFIYVKYYIIKIICLKNPEVYVKTFINMWAKTR